MTGISHELNEFNPLNSFNLPAGQEVSRVPGAVVHANFIMQMGRGRTAGGPDESDDLAFLHFLSDFCDEECEMSVACGQAIPVVDDEQVSVRSHPLGIDDLSICGCVDLGIV